MSDFVHAVCLLAENSGSGVKGTVTFTQAAGGKVHVHGEVSGLKPGQHGFHIHAYGDLRSGCQSAGDHFNPLGKQHGGPQDENRHVGDLGNISANEKGNAVFDFDDTLLQLSGPHSILGRAVVVHAEVDDLGKGGHKDSLTTGNAGARLACGPIGVAPKL
jgi:Cu-Zn family superoxide dismutase